MNDADLLDLLIRLPVSAREVFRRAARANQFERYELAHRLLREPDGEILADLIDRLSLDAETSGREPPTPARKAKQEHASTWGTQQSGMTSR